MRGYRDPSAALRLLQDDKKSGRRKIERLLLEPLPAKVFPSRIERRDKVALLFPPPSLEFFFSFDGVGRVSEFLKIEKPCDPIPGGESWRAAIFMLRHSRHQVAGDSNVQNAADASYDVGVIGARAT
jgi:hypothetical protein